HPPRTTLFPYTTLFRSHAQRRRLAAPRRADEDEELTVADGDVQIIHRRDLAEFLRHMVVGNGRHLGSSMSHRPPRSIGGTYLSRSEEHTSELQSRFDLV